MKIKALAAIAIFTAPFASVQAATNSPYVDPGALLAACQYLATAQSSQPGDGYRNLQCDSSGNLKTTASGGGGSSGTIISSGADGTSNSTSSQAVSSFNYVFNGTTWDRSTGTAAAGQYSTLRQGGSLLSSSNPLFSSISQGGAALSSGNPIFTQITASTAAIGQIGGKTGTVSATTANTSGSAYAAGNEVSTKMTFSSALLTAQSGTLQSIYLACKSVQTAGFKLYVFTTNPTNTTWTDKTAPTINAADIPFLAGVYSLASADSGLGTETLYELDGIGKTLNSASTTLYGVLVTTGTPTFTGTTDCTVSLAITQD